MLVAKLDLKYKIIVVYGGDLCVCEREFVHSVFIILVFFCFCIVSRAIRTHVTKTSRVPKGTKRKGRKRNAPSVMHLWNS